MRALNSRPCWSNATRRAALLAAFFHVPTAHVLRQSVGHVGGSHTVRSDFAPASVDQTLVGGDERDIGIDPQPSVAREHLNVEVQVTRGAIGAVEIIGNNADFFAFLDMAAVQNAVGVHRRRVHVHVAEAYVFVAGVDLKRCRLLLRLADQDGAAGRNHRSLFGVAMLRSVVVRRTGSGPHVLTLMAESTRALGDAETARFTDTLPPGIAGRTYR